MQLIKNKQTNGSQLVALTSLTAEELMALLSVFGPLCEQYFQHHNLEGNPRKMVKYKEDARCSLPGSVAKLDFILMYMKENPRQHYHGVLFSMQQPRVSKWVKVLLPLLEKALAKLKVLPRRFAYALYAFLKSFTRYVLLIDATERDIPRSTANERQRYEYSGKKKSHTVKNHLIVDQDNCILFLSATYAGSIHDKKMADDALHEFPAHTVLVADLAYQGYEQETIMVLLPKKKAKNRQLTEQEKEQNRQISQIRVPVEHVMGGVKRLNIVKEKIRLHLQDVRDRVMLIACGLHNLRTAFRNT